jgi:predicted nuclease of predicted toxin-antitoxin system
MRILVDENIPRMTVEALRANGHDVKDVRGTAQQALADSALWQLAQEEGRLLITTDKGFTSFRSVLHHGILLVRLRQPNRHKINSSVFAALKRFDESDWPNLVVVVRDKTMSTTRG